MASGPRERGRGNLAVLSNDYGAIGLTSDWRLVNVLSLTQARPALSVIGNDVTLRRGDPDTWNLHGLLGPTYAHGINMDRPGQPRGRCNAEQLSRFRGGATWSFPRRSNCCRNSERLARKTTIIDEDPQTATGAGCSKCERLILKLYLYYCR